MELHMSRATADRLAHLEAERLAAPDSGEEPPSEEDVGSAVLNILDSAATISRVKERAGESDQQELMDLIDEEVDAVRAGRSTPMFSSVR